MIGTVSARSSWWICSWSKSPHWSARRTSRDRSPRVPLLHQAPSMRVWLPAWLLSFNDVPINSSLSPKVVISGPDRWEICFLPPFKKIHYRVRQAAESRPDCQGSHCWWQWRCSPGMCQTCSSSQTQPEGSQHLHRFLAPVHQPQEEPSYWGEQLMTQNQVLLLTQQDLHPKTKRNQRILEFVLLSRDKIFIWFQTQQPWNGVNTMT